MLSWPPQDESTPLVTTGTVRRGRLPGWVIAAGPIDWSASTLLRRLLTTVIAEQPECVYVDLHEVRLLDATGVGVLVHCQQLAATASCGFQVIGATGVVRRILEITGMTPVLAGEAWESYIDSGRSVG